MKKKEKQNIKEMKKNVKLVILELHKLMILKLNNQMNKSKDYLIN